MFKFVILIVYSKQIDDINIDINIDYNRHETVNFVLQYSFVEREMLYSCHRNRGLNSAYLYGMSLLRQRYFFIYLPT